MQDSFSQTGFRRDAFDQGTGFIVAERQVNIEIKQTFPLSRQRVFASMDS
jgi:hypothetical protein